MKGEGSGMGEETEENMYKEKRNMAAVMLVVLHFSFAAFAPCASAGETPAACTPYTFAGRVMDAQHDAFGSNRVARIEAADANGEPLARTKTLFRDDSRRNYILQIPMATGKADGYAVRNATLDIKVTDDVGKVWSGVVVDAAAGVPGDIREVDIVLGEDRNGDGVDDSLYARLKSEWEDSDYWQPGETFDPHKDYDGDGMSTINEALAGTNPFDPDDALRITGFSYAGGSRSRAPGSLPVSLAFNAIGGRAYTVEEATSLADKDWKPREFFLPGSDSPVNVLSVPSGSGRSASVVYLLPSSATNAFFRVRAE